MKIVARVKNNADKITESKNQAVANTMATQTISLHGEKGPEPTAQNNSWAESTETQRVKQLKSYQTMADHFTSETIQQKEIPQEDTMPAPSQRKENNTGLPDNLKTGIENLSGYSMDDVKVHYNSAKPTQLQAYAYAQGTDIHLASGQEKHLPHEAWHVVQQKQERVQPTLQLKGKVNVNDDAGLEHEADVMGEKALHSYPSQLFNNEPALSVSEKTSTETVQRVIEIEGETYTKDNLEEFNKKYGEHERDILSAMSDLSHTPRNIKSALEDARTIIVTVSKDEEGLLFSADTAPEKVALEGGLSREAGAAPVLITKPSAGFEELSIAGLIMCIGIVLEATKSGSIQAASGSHFVTPDLIKGGALTDEGQNALLTQVALTKPFGTLSAKLMHVDGRATIESSKMGKATIDAYSALNLIVPFLLSAGVTVVHITMGSAKRTYKLFDDGTGKLE